MTARHWASPVRVPWSSTRLHRLRACISNLELLACIVTPTVTMSARSSRHLSRFPALSTISAERYCRVYGRLPFFASSARLDPEHRRDRRYGVAKPAQAVPVLALGADAWRWSSAVDRQCQPIGALPSDHVLAGFSCSRVDWHWQSILSGNTVRRWCTHQGTGPQCCC